MSSLIYEFCCCVVVRPTPGHLVESKACLASFLRVETDVIFFPHRHGSISLFGRIMEFILASRKVAAFPSSTCPESVPLRTEKRNTSYILRVDSH